jgi:hypothetical protein
MKKFFLPCLILFAMNTTQGQIEFRNSILGRQVNLNDRDGSPMSKIYEPDITGSPFLKDEWVQARLILFDRKELGPLKAKLNIERNELYFIDSSGTEMVAINGKITKVDFLNTFSKDSIRYVFKCGYPAIASQNEYYYYWLLTEGKIELLAKKFRYIRANKDVLSGEVSKEFIEGATVLYVFSGGKIQELQPGKNNIITLTKDKEQDILRFIDASKINVKKTADLVKLFNYYNGLQ